MNLIKFIDYKITQQKECYFIECEEVDAFAHGDTEEDAKDSLNFVLNSLYENYALEEDGKLSDKAIKFKHKLLRIFKDAKIRKIAKG